MTIALLIFFWASLAILFYTYAGYPVALWIAKTLRPRRHVVEEDYLPSVSFVIAAHNEDAAIAAKLENTLELDYPRDRLEIIVSSDGSTDGTNEIVASFADRGVKLLAAEEQSGKLVAVARAVEVATGDVVVFSDATGVFNREALRKMARHFADGQVGGVAGEVSYVAGDSVVGEGTGAYWRYETLVKRLQSAAFSNTTISGAINAIRRKLYPHVPPETGSDMIVPMSVLRKGYRVVYEPEAVAREATTERVADELAMRVRIPVRGFASMAYARGAMNPFLHPGIFFNVVSHKALRWLAGLFMILLFVANLALVGRPGFYVIFLVVQLLFYAAAAIGYLLRDRRKTVFNIPYYFCLLNFAALVGLWQYLAGRRISSWEPAR